MLQTMLLELVDRVVARVVALGLGRDDLVQQLAGAVRTAGFVVRLRHGDRLAERTSPLRRHDDETGARWCFQHDVPFLCREVSLGGHPTSPLRLGDRLLRS